jgi:hypothetical protein
MLVSTVSGGRKMQRVRAFFADRTRGRRDYLATYGYYQASLDPLPMGNEFIIGKLIDLRLWK